MKADVTHSDPHIRMSWFEMRMLCFLRLIMCQLSICEFPVMQTWPVTKMDVYFHIHVSDLETL